MLSAPVGWFGGHSITSYRSRQALTGTETWEWAAWKQQCEVVLWAQSREIQDLMLLPGQLQCEECWVCPSLSGQRGFARLTRLEATLFPKGIFQDKMSYREDALNRCGKCQNSVMLTQEVSLSKQWLSQSCNIFHTWEKNNQLKGLLPLFSQYISSISTYIKESLGNVKKKSSLDFNECSFKHSSWNITVDVKQMPWCLRVCEQWRVICGGGCDILLEGCHFLWCLFADMHSSIACSGLNAVL